MDSINNEDSQTDFYVDGIHYRVDNSGSGIIRPIFQIIDTHLCATDCESTGFIFAHSSRMNCTFDVDEERWLSDGRIVKLEPEPEPEPEPEIKYVDRHPLMVKVLLDEMIEREMAERELDE